MIEPRYGSYNATGERYPAKKSNKVSNAAAAGSLAAAVGTGVAAGRIGAAQKKVDSAGRTYKRASGHVDQVQRASRNVRQVPVGGAKPNHSGGGVKYTNAKASILGQYQGAMDKQSKAAAAGVKSLKALQRFRMGALLGGGATVGLGVTAANTRAKSSPGR